MKCIHIYPNQRDADSPRGEGRQWMAGRKQGSCLSCQKVMMSLGRGERKKHCFVVMCHRVGLNSEMLQPRLYPRCFAQKPQKLSDSFESFMDHPLSGLEMTDLTDKLQTSPNAIRGIWFVVSRPDPRRSVTITRGAALTIVH